VSAGARVKPDAVIGTILKHDAKVTSYKIALLRALNDVVLTFPDLHAPRRDVAVPLTMLARFWVAYYWPFVDPRHPIMQGPRALRATGLTNDMAFRPHLTALRAAWEQWIRGAARPSDGYFLAAELRAERKRALYPRPLVAAHDRAVQQIARTIEMPIRYAGGGNAEWTVFARPKRRSALPSTVAPVPGTNAQDVCVVIVADLWHAFRDLSLWIEALAIHEWCLFTATVTQPDGAADRGTIYRLLTDHPENRRPLTWERNQIDLLLLEGNAFICPWTEKRISIPGEYALDHLVPVSVYPTNELWNLAPSDPDYNAHIKRDRIPASPKLQRAEVHLATTCALYGHSAPLRRAMVEDVGLRFATDVLSEDFATAVAGLVVAFMEQVADLRSLRRY
jgi:hypothetical protein